MELSILIALRDAASAGADRISERIKALGKSGRETLKVYEDLRKDVQKGITIGGIGMAGIGVLRQGVRVAGDFQSAMTDLKLAYGEMAEGGLAKTAEFADQLNRLEHLGVQLGNRLPGNTQMYIEMLAQLKQGGLETQTVLEGAGKSVAELAVVSNRVPADLAKEFAQFGKQFDLKPEEYTKAADLFAKVKIGRNLGATELIEGSKYFQLRAGSALGLKGIEGAETGARLMAALKGRGLEGGVAGTGSSALFRELADAKKLKEFERMTGLKLNIFDRDGNFGGAAGIDRTFREFEKLRTLSSQKLIMAMDKLAGSEGAAAGQVMVQMGLEGWKAENAELNKRASLQEQVNQKTEDFNNKMESLSGTFDNLKVTAFEPLLEPLGALVDLTNDAAGGLQSWMSAHETTTSAVAHLFALGSATMAVTGAVKTGTAAYRIWNLTRAIRSEDEKALGWWARFRGELRGAGDGAQGAAAKYGNLRRAVSTLPPSVKIGIALIGIEFAISQVSALRTEYEILQGLLDENAGTAKKGMKQLSEIERLMALKGKQPSNQMYATDAALAMRQLNANNELKSALMPEIMKFFSSEAMGSFFFQRFSSAWSPTAEPYFDRDIAADQIKLRAPQLESSQVMAEFIKRIDSLGLSDEAKSKLFASLEKAFPTAFKEAMIPVRQVAGEVVLDFAELKQASSSSTTALRDTASAASHAASELQKIKASGGKDDPPVVKVPGAATGGYVGRGGLVRVHSDETIVPAHISRLNYSGRGPRSAQAAGAGVTKKVKVTIQNINVSGGSAKGEDPRLLAQKVAHEVKRQVEKY